MKILVLNGPNLNLLGVREPNVYGHETLKDIENACKKLAAKLNIELVCYQSNHEGDLIDKIQWAREDFDALIFNPGGYSHTSVAIADALRVLEFPIIEVHLTNIFAREEFRHHSYVSPVATGVITGLGTEGYLCAIRTLASILKK